MKFSLIRRDDGFYLTIKGQVIELTADEFRDLYIFLVYEWDKLISKEGGKHNRSSILTP